MSNDLTAKTDALLEHVMYCDFRNNIGIASAKAAIRTALRRERATTETLALAKIREEGQRTRWQNEDLPNQVGYYWVEWNDGEKTMHQIYTHVDDGLQVMGHTKGIDCYYDTVEGFFGTDEIARWAGPIPLPEDV